MTNYPIFWLVVAVFGLWLMVHCTRATLREFRAGIARGLDVTASVARTYERKLQPIGFWFTIVATFLAGIMGIVFVGFGIWNAYGGTK